MAPKAAIAFNSDSLPTVMKDNKFPDLISRMDSLNSTLHSLNSTVLSLKASIDAFIYRKKDVSRFVNSDSTVNITLPGHESMESQQFFLLPKIQI